jgi:hypothetical protein
MLSAAPSYHSAGVMLEDMASGVVVPDAAAYRAVLCRAPRREEAVSWLGRPQAAGITAGAARRACSCPRPMGARRQCAGRSACGPPAFRPAQLLITSPCARSAPGRQSAVGGAHGNRQSRCRGDHIPYLLQKAPRGLKAEGLAAWYQARCQPAEPLEGPWAAYRRQGRLQKALRLGPRSPHTRRAKSCP